MNSHTEYLKLNVPQRMGFINITTQVQREVNRSGIREGLVLVNAMHITASVFINDDEPGLHEDYKKWLEELAPFDPSPQRYKHNRTGEDNADAHSAGGLAERHLGRQLAVCNGRSDAPTSFPRKRESRGNHMRSGCPPSRG